MFVKSWKNSRIFGFYRGAKLRHRFFGQIFFKTLSSRALTTVHEITSGILSKLNRKFHIFSGQFLLILKKVQSARFPGDNSLECDNSNLLITRRNDQRFFAEIYRKVFVVWMITMVNRLWYSIFVSFNFISICFFFFGGGQSSTFIKFYNSLSFEILRI